MEVMYGRFRGGSPTLGEEANQRAPLSVVRRSLPGSECRALLLAEVPLGSLEAASKANGSGAHRRGNQSDAPAATRSGERVGAPGNRAGGFSDRGARARLTVCLLYTSPSPRD